MLDRMPRNFESHFELFDEGQTTKSSEVPEYCELFFLLDIYYGLNLTYRVIYLICKPSRKVRTASHIFGKHVLYN